MKQLIPFALVLALLATAGSSLAVLETAGEVGTLVEETVSEPLAFGGALTEDFQAKTSAVVALVTFLTANMASSGNAAVALGATIIASATDGSIDPAALPAAPGALAWADDASSRCFADQVAATQAYLGAKAGMDDVAGAFAAAYATCRASSEYTTIANAAADAAAASAGAEASDLAAFFTAVGPPL